MKKLQMYYMEAPKIKERTYEDVAAGRDLWPIC